MQKDPKIKAEFEFNGISYKTRVQFMKISFVPREVLGVVGGISSYLSVPPLQDAYSCSPPLRPSAQRKAISAPSAALGKSSC
jgi:hypothetical protein